MLKKIKYKAFLVCLSLIILILQSCNYREDVKAALLGNWIIIKGGDENISDRTFNFRDDGLCLTPSNRGNWFKKTDFEVLRKEDKHYLVIPGSCDYCDTLEIANFGVKSEERILSDTLILEGKKRTLMVERAYNSVYQQTNWKIYWRSNVRKGNGLE